MSRYALHRYAWVAAAAVAVFLLEFAGAFRVGAGNIFASFLAILLAGFFAVRWFAAFLALLVFALAAFLAPFWMLEAGISALAAFLLALVAPFLTGHRFLDFLILVAAGTVAVGIADAFMHGGPAFGALARTLAANIIAGAGAFWILSRAARRHAVVTRL